MLARVRDAILARWGTSIRRVRRPAFFTLRHATPLSNEWGFDRGTPIDRYYIEQFLGEHAADIRGRALEVKSAAYTERFGSGVTQADVLDIAEAGNPNATIVTDLTAADAIPGDQFDCFILTQTLQFIYDVRAAITHAHRLLKPGGVLLATVPVVSRIAPRYGRETDYWRFTAASCTRLFGDVFGAGEVTVRTFGNVLVGVAFLEGAACEELPDGKLDVNDPYFPILVTVRAVKA